MTALALVDHGWDNTETTPIFWETVAAVFGVDTPTLPPTSPPPPARPSTLPPEVEQPTPEPAPRTERMRGSDGRWLPGLPIRTPQVVPEDPADQQTLVIPLIPGVES